ncbi:MAG: DUF86 domain-containing protein [Cellulomonadaceae bacterium]|jgi:uncharacterized protein with HEPN domain|nr:DUF86 domain-containing protein [Cellulomonadaceae bacterium]
MAKNAGTYLWEALEACKEITLFIGDLDAAEYQADLLRVRAVERSFGILGEALKRVREHYPDIAARIGPLANAVDMRNFLAHEYH